MHDGVIGGFVMRHRHDVNFYYGTVNGVKPPRGSDPMHHCTKQVVRLKGMTAALAICLMIGHAGASLAQTDNPIGPHEVCQKVRVQNPPTDSHRIAGTAIGAVGGGLVGHTIGAGKGNTLATVGGAVAGGYAGNKVQQNYQANHPTYHYEERCHQAQE
jgi:uncharacterized protein YcfJ